MWWVGATSIRRSSISFASHLDSALPVDACQQAPDKGAVRVPKWSRMLYVMFESAASASPIAQHPGTGSCFVALASPLGRPPSSAWNSGRAPSFVADSGTDCAIQPFSTRPPEDPLHTWPPGTEATLISPPWSSPEDRQETAPCPITPRRRAVLFFFFASRTSAA